MPRTKPQRPIDPRLARKLVAFGELAAFLDGFDGHPLDGVIEYFNKKAPGGLRANEQACIRAGYRSAVV